jgi:hypothetical protein
MRRVISLFSFAIVLFLALACSEEFVPVPYTYTKVFTGENSKTWKIKFLEETLDGKIIDRFSVSCASDDRYKFYGNTEHKFEALTGTQKCSGTTEPNTIEDTWTFTNSSATLTMILPFFSPDSSVPLIVRDVDKDEMELEIFFNEGNTGSYRIHFEVVDEN